MKTIREMIKDLTDITVEQWKINKYLKSEILDLQDANLVGVDLRNANLRRSDLQGANLFFAKLRDVNLTNVLITKATIRTIKYYWIMRHI
ncbi:MAG: pentapeptide repeat-containing protein [Spiroplasma phoeniceum]|nr:MAG: pentapeptide repeat-containing protein [Spiroplasma phoeniceum]UZQ33134.1 MAG: pentapeptide repeat-containing protein [Spiroplasma phoeniceum]